MYFAFLASSSPKPAGSEGEKSLSLFSGLFLVLMVLVSLSFPILLGPGSSLPELFCLEPKHFSYHLISVQSYQFFSERSG